MKDKLIHPCSSCRYAYIVKCNDKVVFYNALADEMQELIKKIDEPCCGFAPGGTALDRNQPKCSSFDSGKEK